MTWSWSHTEEGIAAVRDNIFRQPREWLETVWAEWIAAERETDYGCHHLNTRKFHKALCRAKGKTDEYLAETIWERTEQLAECENGGHNAYCCPFACGPHMLPFHPAGFTVPERWTYSGDVNLEHGGTFLDVSQWDNESVSVVRVTDMGSAIGFHGAVMIEQGTVYGFDRPDLILRALSSAGLGAAFEERARQYAAFAEAIQAAPDDDGPKQMLEDWWNELGAEAKAFRLALAEALMNYGFCDYDDCRTRTVQTDRHESLHGPDDFTAAEYLEGELLDYVIQNFLED